MVTLLSTEHAAIAFWSVIRTTLLLVAPVSKKSEAKT